MVKRQFPPKQQIVRQVPIRRQPVQQHPFIEAWEHAGKVLDSLGDLSGDLV